MLQRSLLCALLALAGLLGAAEGARAQSAACQRYQAELASLPRGGARQASAAAERQRAEIARTTNYFRSIGCDQGPVGFFGSTASECPAIGQRIKQMEAAYAQILAQADGSELDMRRRQLEAAVAQACGAPQEVQQRPRNFLEQLFGVPQRQEAQPLPPDELLPDERPFGGRRLACVRSCDGYAFPLSNAPHGRESADEMCQALCPGTETMAYAMPGGDDALNQAISIRTNRPYVQSPNAFKFQKSFDSACSCKKQGETWAQLLRQAESMLDQRRGDLIVTEQKAEELSRPRTTPPQLPRDRRNADRRATDAAEAQAAAEAGAAAPTASGESAGIVRTVETNRVIGRSEGERREIPDRSGATRVVRVIATNVIPVPQNAPR